MNSVESFGKGEKAAKIGFFTVALVGIVKGIIGWTSGSLSLLAQAIDSLTDLFGLIAIFIGMRLSRREPSMRFPFACPQPTRLTAYGSQTQDLLRALEP